MMALRWLQSWGLGVPRACVVALAALCILHTPHVLAHASSSSYLALQQRGADLVLRADLHLRDIDRVFDLDADRDGRVTWGETEQRGPDVQTWLQQGLRLSSAGADCALQPLDLLMSERADGNYLSGEWRVACAGEARPRELSLRYGLLFDQDNLHRAVVKVDIPGAETSALLSPDRPEASLLQAQPRSSGEVLLNYVVEGVWHIWIGIDHILFLLGLLVLAPLQFQRSRVVNWPARNAFRPALMDVVSVVTAFTVAHSITLGLSIFGVLTPPAVLIETVIALSVVLAALNNLLGGFSLKRWRLAFVFGLIHGFGFANVLLDLELPTTQLALALGGFNLGVELGQLAIVAVFVPIAWWLRRTAFYRWGIVAGGSIAIAIIGTVWIVQRLGF